MTHKRASLTPGEATYLSALLLDRSVPETVLQHASKKLNDSMLFSVIPFDDATKKDDPDAHTSIQQQEQQRRRTSRARPFQNLCGLWNAFEDGVRPKALTEKTTKTNASNIKGKALADEKKEENNGDEDDKKGDDDGSILSNVEVRHDDKDDQSASSSIEEEDAAPDHFDTWEVLKDEYANDFGFDYKPELILSLDNLEDDENHSFKILGTSADDKASHPHVLSPPLMDSLMTFLPDLVTNENYWLKYSLVRDGASLDTLRRYVRGAPRTILAIETADGQVFGSFTSNNWRNERGFYGDTGESFLWRMRHSRCSKCHSLFEQAQMESEIDVYFYSNENDMIQLCNYKLLAVGGGELETVDVVVAAAISDEGHHNVEDHTLTKERSQRFGFGLSVDEFMLHGSSSPCATYRNTCLVDGGANGKDFEIVNLEVWTLTPCTTVEAAEKLEMTKFFIHESSRSAGHGRTKHTGSIDDLESVEDSLQDRFYRRVGESDESAQQRDIWQYANMMNVTK